MKVHTVSVIENYHDGETHGPKLLGVFRHKQDAFDAANRYQNEHAWAREMIVDEFELLEGQTALPVL